MGLKLTKDQARAVLELTSHPQWTVLSHLLLHRLAQCHKALEITDNYRFEQGRVVELRAFIELEDSAKAVLEAAHRGTRGAADL
jgi:hypothetical protein